MKMLKPAFTAGAAAAFAFVLLAQSSFTGRWVAEITTPNGDKRETTFFLTQSGDRLSGAVLNGWRMQNISEGKITGDEAVWTVVVRFGQQERRIEYHARLRGDQLTVSLPGFGRAAAPRDVVARRISTDGAPIHPFANLPKATIPALHDVPDNGLARTPPMGWNSWNHFNRRIDDKTVREIADAMVASGMKDAGYLYVNIDDTWQGERDSKGVLQPNKKFPDMKALADYVHRKGLKLGIYSSPGPRTCANYEGSYNHEEIDARTWATWGIDYLKYDWCSASEVYKPSDMQAVYQRMGDALRAAGRPIVYSLCQYGLEHVETWGPRVGGNLWRTTGDISDNWRSMSDIGFNRQLGLEKYAGPGHWNDPDMLEVGNGGMSAAEYRTHMSLWAILAAPLLAGNDIRTMTAETREILCNREVIAIDQDKAGHQGYRISKEGEAEVWAKPLAGGDWAVGLFNRGESPVRITVRWSDLKLSGRRKVRDLWAHEDMGAFENFSAEVQPHGVTLVRVAR
ncbi:MAG TPA: glycoside hydrolase family 27 protein [Bryobacteraceae bacterium]|jgi:alpha-galactosidase|nr:glycoside hydrolase family 27 protein [Bryobacteraceae bacterium]